MALQTWLHSFGAVGTSCEAEISQTLAQAGINTCALNMDIPRGPGILLFDKIVPALSEFLREVSHGGIERVLAIAVSRTAFHDGSDWQLLKVGASDVFAWESFANPASEVLARLERWEQIDTLVHSPVVKNNLVGQSSTWISSLRQIVEVARFTDASLLLVGDTGTGKELAARLIHTLDPRSRKGDLVVLDCTTIVPELSGSEFFGHERGAFTGAVSSRDGAFALADDGTLFLDEVGDLPLALQAQLLRVIQEGMYKRVGGNTWQQTNFRLVCASNHDLLQEVMRGKFRRDLYYRIATITCKLPPLRERLEDIVPLARHFLKLIRPSEEPPDLGEPVRSYLLSREYPGNVRELKQLVTHIMYRHVGSGPITVGDLPEEERPGEDFIGSDWCDTGFEKAIRRAIHLGAGLKEIRRKVTETAIRIATGEEGGSVQRAALKLGVTSRALQIRRATRRQSDQSHPVRDKN